MSPAMTFGDALLVLTRALTRYDELHEMIRGHANHYAAGQKLRPSPATAALVTVLRYEADSIAQARSRLLTAQRDMVAGAAMRDAEFDAELRAAESAVNATVPFDITDRGDENFSQDSGDIQVVDFLRITGHKDTPSQDKAA